MHGYAFIISFTFILSEKSNQNVTEYADAHDYKSNNIEYFFVQRIGMDFKMPTKTNNHKFFAPSTYFKYVYDL